VQIDYSIFREHKIEIFWEFVIRNYVMVLDEMLYNGRSIVNTVIYCLLAIISALIVNPLAAYAMSRYKLRATYKIILVLMLTMAFPAMVMGIPNFLIMKRFGMLNTFWALILPGLADGYFIFLLKGFFDSLPKELFESATLDGASEWVIFWRIAMSLSKPIMAVIALNAFNAAYRNFMFAFIVCQDKSMWTMMVNIYQMMQRTSAGVGFAALVIASIPTFAVFVFFQNIIIRGIVVPTEK
jgi:ABC-type glycerol-3-phosphate transport system permease component